METVWLPVLFAMFVWWFSTGLILALNLLPGASRGVIMLAATAVLVAALLVLQQWSGEASVVSAYVSFTAALAVWAWIEVAFLTGLVTGPSKSPADRLRESLFNILAHGFDAPLEGARVIDLFAGTGALGLEALSRGAAFALFVDDGAEARALLRANIEALGVAGRTKVFRRDATKLGAMPPGDAFTLAFLDPPYGRGLAPRALDSLRAGGWLAPSALVVVEEEAGAAIELPPGYEALDRRNYGDTGVTFLRAAER